jgi:molybdenum ABC transporter ATP-binding protein
VRVSSAPALHVNVEVRRGNFELKATLEVGNQVLVLFGPSGSGKSTTLQAIAGLVTPQAGDISLNGKLLFQRVPGRPRVNLPARDRRVGYVFQDYALFPHLTALGNVGFAITRSPKSRLQALDFLDRVGLADVAHRYPDELSGGQQQRVALARALAPNPDLLLLDEPFASLDAELRRSLRRELRTILSQTGIPVVLVTHDREEALALGDVVQVIDQGRPLSQGEPLQVLGQPGQGRVARLVGVENLLPMRVESLLPQDGTMICVAGPGNAEGQRPLRLEVPLSDFRQNDAVTVGIRASDIILSQERLLRSSARNQLPGRVSAVEHQPPGYQVALECSGATLRCHITGSALHDMNIELGMQLWAVFKASSCFLVSAEDGPA